MSSDHPRRPIIRKRSSLWNRIRWQWPALVWIALAVFAAWLYDNGGEYIRINGMVEVISETVGPLESGYLKAVHVMPGDTVEAGEVIAEMDTTYIDYQIAALENTLQAQRADDLREFHSARYRIEEELKSVTLEYAEAGAEKAIYGEELKQLEALVEDGFASAESLLDPRVRLAVLEERLALYPTFIVSLERQLDELDELRTDALGADYPDSSDHLQGQMQLLQERRKRHFLKAGQSGIAAEVLRQPGEVIETGERIVEIITRQEPRILAFMSESDTRPIALGDRVMVEPVIGGERIESEVVGISPNVLSLPDRASPIPNRVVRGRRLILVPKTSTGLPPGSSVVVLLPRREMFITSLFGGRSK